ncbi:MAG: hypothetical protein ACLS9K_12985 [Lachnospira eligens]
MSESMTAMYLRRLIQRSVRKRQEYLEDKGIVMSASVREKAFTQRFYLYLIMTKSAEKLYMSYAVKTARVRR